MQILVIVGNTTEVAIVLVWAKLPLLDTPL